MHCALYSESLPLYVCKLLIRPRISSSTLRRGSTHSGKRLSYFYFLLFLSYFYLHDSNEAGVHGGVERGIKLTQIEALLAVEGLSVCVHAA